MVTPFYPNGSFPAFQLSSLRNTVGRPTFFFTQFGKQRIFDSIQEMSARAQSITVTESDSTAPADLKCQLTHFRDPISERISKDVEE